MPNNENLLEINHLSKKFLDTQPLIDINCTVRQGEVISIIGPSGTGKSTLLRCINRLEKPTGGKIFFHGEEITDDPSVIRRIRQKIGMVFQSFNLFSNMSVLENIIKPPMMLKKIPKADAVKKAMELLETVELTEKAANYRRLFLVCKIVQEVADRTTPTAFVFFCNLRGNSNHRYCLLSFPYRQIVAE